MIKEKTDTRNHLELMLESVSRNIISREDRSIAIELTTKSSLKEFSIDIPGDISSASYLIGLAVLMRSSKITINDVLINPLRMGFVNTLQKMGANIVVERKRKEHNEEVGRIIVHGDSELIPCNVSREIVPSMIDEIPMLSLICSYVSGVSIIDGVNELRYKESDRLSGIENILSAMGVDVKIRKDKLMIIGKNKLYNTNKLINNGDHRLAMMISCQQIISDGDVYFDDCIDISFPEFKELINKLMVH